MQPRRKFIGASTAKKRKKEKEKNKQTEWNQKAKSKITKTLSKSESQKATINRRKRAANQPAARQRLSGRQPTNQATS